MRVRGATDTGEVHRVRFGIQRRLIQRRLIESRVTAGARGKGKRAHLIADGRDLGVSSPIVVRCNDGAAGEYA